MKNGLVERSGRRERGHSLLAVGGQLVRFRHDADLVADVPEPHAADQLIKVLLLEASGAPAVWPIVLVLQLFAIHIEAQRAFRAVLLDSDHGFLVDAPAAARAAQAALVQLLVAGADLPAVVRRARHVLQRFGAQREADVQVAVPRVLLDAHSEKGGLLGGLTHRYLPAGRRALVSRCAIAIREFET